MGLLKRLLSIGSKKNKKSHTTTPEIPPPLPSLDERQRNQEQEEEDHEVAIGRLLRSSSSRYAVVKEVDYTSLPPLPHPINDVLAQRSQSQQQRQHNRGYGLHPSPSMASLASSTFSTHSTFSVTVHDRQRHTATEFPHANGELNADSRTPAKSNKNFAANDNGNHLGLRSDPSVASLLSLYDEHGRLPPSTFSNSPPTGEKKERQQTKRSGSTLRELLGASNSSNSKLENIALESDISWAERFLGETDSIISSCGPHTPTTGHDATNDRTPIPELHDTSFCSIMDDTSVINDPAISSMEVELSVVSDNSSILDPVVKNNSPYRNMDPSTPQRASQVFSFLTRKNTVHEERPLPSAFSSPSDVSDDNIRSRFSTDGSSESPALDATIKRSSYRIFSEASEVPDEKEIPEETTTVDPTNKDESADPFQRQIKVLMNGPTKVIVTAPTPGTAPTPSRIPIRGPRAAPGKRRSSASRRTPMLTQRMNSINGPSSQKLPRSKDASTRKQRRPPSQGSNISNISSIAEADTMAAVRVLDQLSRSKTYHHSPSRDKENQLAAKMELPSTPIRSNTTSRTSLFRKVVTPSFFQPPIELVPSPASSSELSPVGKQMMVDARKMRMRTREAEPERKRPPSRI